MAPSEERMRLAYEERVRELRRELEMRERELAILSEIAARIHGAETVPDILGIALDELLEQLQLKAAWVFLGDAKTSRLELAAARGVSQGYLNEIATIGLGECLCPEVFWTQHTMQARNTVQCPRMPDIVEALHEPVAHACIPLRFEQDRRGVLNVAARPNEQFSDSELRFLETVGYQICIAVERARHLDAEHRRNREARALAAINKGIGASLDAGEVLEAVARTAAELLATEQVYVLLGHDPTDVEVGYVYGPVFAGVEPGERVDLEALGWSLSATTLREGRMIRMDDREGHPGVNRDVARQLDVGSALVAPLVGHDRPLGVLLLTRRAAHRWNDDEIEIAETLATQAALALERARLYEEARNALRDLRNAQAKIIQTEKMAVLGTFASGLAHEVRNPLNSITLQLSVLERRVARLDAPANEQLAGLAAIIREEVHRLDRLVSDFLLFSRTGRIQHKAAELGALLDEVVQLLRPEAKAAGVALKRQRLAERAPAVHMDTQKMKQVVINLVRNAIEAMTDGGSVTIRDGMVDGRACFVISDTGPGLPDDVDIFQLFVTTKPKGTGLGLSIAQQIVLDHGGELNVSSEPGNGATFQVYLPLPPDSRGGGPS